MIFLRCSNPGCDWHVDTTGMSSAQMAEHGDRHAVVCRPMDKYEALVRAWAKEPCLSFTFSSDCRCITCCARKAVGQ